ncbi:S-adenosyl-L-methionine-dependent methyltransferase [Xylariomycetidae sp. FL2044]|nr:S-adenosyl-L-methionine-dependent methyltransferase [Xylariomycetidae sp. FL2044]
MDSKEMVMGDSDYEHEELVSADDMTMRTSTSLCTLATQYIYAGGRRYHSFRAGRYPMPNDEIEQQREELMHILVLDIMDDALFAAPMQRDPVKVLDLATGVGWWAVEMGDRYPDARILGVDLSPIQPSLVPPNVAFEVDDIEDDWVRDSDYDFIHMREISVYIRTTPAVIQKAYRHLEPGGWLEISDFHYDAHLEDGTLAKNHPVNRFLECMRAYWRRVCHGAEHHEVPSTGARLADAGFVNVQRRVYKVPWGSWPPAGEGADGERARRQGIYLRAAFEPAVPACANVYFTMGMTPEEIEGLYVDVSRALHDDSIRCYAEYYVWSGQKPL